MKHGSVIRIVVTGMIAVALGAAPALAESLVVRVVEGDSAQTVTVDVEGSAETIAVGDLEDGGQRSFIAGDHEILVRRDGDRLEVLLDGRPITVHRDGPSVWVGDDGVVTDLGAGDRRIVVVSTDATVKVAEGDGAYVWTTGDGEVPEEVEVVVERLRRELAGEGGNEGREGVVVLRSLGGDEPVVLDLDAAADRVRYRCGESGSELLVSREDAIHDTYVDPATGCLMARVEEPGRRIVTVVRESRDEAPENAD